MTIPYHPMLAFYGGGAAATRFYSHHPWLYFSLIGVAIALTIWRKSR
jgi:hypothetical protein